MRFPLIFLALGACTGPTPTELPTCGVQATSNLSGTVPFTSDLTVELSGEDVETARVALYEVETADRVEVSWAEGTSDGPNTFTLTPAAGLSENRSYEIEVSGCDGEVVDVLSFETNEEAHPITDWSAFDGVEWYLDLDVAAPGLNTDTGVPVLTIHADASGPTSVDLDYFVVADSEWWTCADTIELDWTWDGKRLHVAHDEMVIVGVAALVAQIEPEFGYTEFSCGISPTRNTLVDCRAFMLGLVSDDPCWTDPNNEDRCVPCGEDSNMSCYDLAFDRIPVGEVSVERPDPFWDDECNYYFQL